MGGSRQRRGTFVERLRGIVVEDAPGSVLGRVISAFGAGSGDAGPIDKIVASFAHDLGAGPGLAGARGVDTAAGRHLLYHAAPHDVALSVYEDDGWRVIGQLLADPGTPAPTVVEVEVGEHRAASRLDPETGEFDLEHLPSGVARLVFIGADHEVIVEAIPLERES